ncbi:MAG: extracellular solute-binding protein [Lachnospiraceae bacterium]|nr:extracellular solute-binding protein [Lachnospiraceae bacterium]
MKKIICLILALLLAAGTLSGCHGTLVPDTTAAATEAPGETKESVPGETKETEAAKDDNVFKVPDSFDTSKEITLTFWLKNDSNKTQVSIYEKAMADFTALYPNVTFKFKKYTDYGEIYNDVVTNIATKTTPNVCITYPDHIATYLTGADTMVALDKLMTDPKYGFGGSELKFKKQSPTVDEIVPKFLAEGVLQGHQYALPFMRSTEALYINQDMVEKLGYTLPEVCTWDFIWEVSEAAMKKNDDGTYAVNGQKVLIPFIYKSTDNMMIQMLRQLDAGYSTDDGKILLFNDQTASVLKEIAKHAMTRSFSTFKNASYPGNYLNAGQCIFAIDSTAGATWMGHDAHNQEIPQDQRVKFRIAVQPIPQFDTENPKMISQGPSVCIFNKSDPQEVLASWLFTQFLLTNDVQIAYSQTEGYVPVTLKAQNSEEYQNYLSRAGQDNDMYYHVKIEAAELLINNVENSFVTPVFNGSASLRNAAGTLIEEAVKNGFRKKATDDAFITALYEKTIALYHLDKSAVVDPSDPVTEPETNEAGETVAPPETQVQPEPGPAEPEPLPKTARSLLYCLVIAWIGIAAVWLIRMIKTKREKR